MGFWKNTSRKHSHIDRATGRNKRETGQLAKRSRRAEQGGSFTVSAPRRRNGRIVESRAAWRRRQKTGW